MFETLVSKKKSEHVVEQILDAIKSGRYGPGDKLPPEDEIAEQTGVSRSSVREALESVPKLIVREVVQQRVDRDCKCRTWN